MAKENLSQWSGQFGNEYTIRNLQSIDEMESMFLKNYGTTRTGMNRLFIDHLKRDISILEVGCNIGNQLICLQQMGFKRLYGIEPNESAVKIAKERTRNIDIIQGSGLNLPFESSCFDLVFTSGVLIHVPPTELPKVIEEIHRVTRLYIWGFEYFSDHYTTIKYQDKPDMMWKGDFAKTYRNQFKDLRLIKEIPFRYTGNDNIDTMFILSL